MRRSMSNTTRGGSQANAAAPISFLPPGAYTESRHMNRAWGWAQLAVAYGLLQVALWTTPPTQLIAGWAAAVWIVAVTVGNRRSLRELGLGLSGLRGALIAVSIAAVAAALILLAGYAAGTLRILYGPTPPLWHSAGYAVWALEQEFILQSFFFVTLEKLLRDSTKALWGAAILFSAAHIPNPLLVAATFLAALFFVSIFRRYRNLYPLGLAHAMLGLSLAVTVPDALIHHMRVGISYLNFVVR